MATTTKTPFDLLREHVTGTVDELAEAIHGECIHPETGRELDGATVLEHWHDTEYPQFDEEHLPETLELSRHQLANIITEAAAARHGLKPAQKLLASLVNAAMVALRVLDDPGAASVAVREAACVGLARVVIATSGTVLRLEHTGFGPEHGMTYDLLSEGWRQKVAKQLEQTVSSID